MADKTTTESPISDKLSAEQETPVQSPPANPIGSKFSMKMNSMAGSKSTTSSIPPTEPSLNSHPATAKSKPASIVPIKMSLTPKVSGTKRVATDDVVVAKVFNSDDLGDDEEMPPEAKMRMRNLGKDTPTASGPNSFNKGKLGFCNRQKAIEKDLSLIKPH